MISPIDANLDGKRALVTGASAGIGREVARDLARLGAVVHLAARSAERLERARADITDSVPQAKLHAHVVDFGNQKSIRAFAMELARAAPQLNILVNNAGIFAGERAQSAEGHELTWATNPLGYFLVTELLRPQLTQHARIVNVASGFAFGLELDDVDFQHRPWSGSAAYAQSKQANRMWTWALARRLSAGQTANAMHPGAVDTQLLKSGFGGGGRKVEAGADTVSWLAASKEVEGVSGKFWMDRRERRCELRNEADEERLWSLCEAMTREK